MLRVLHGPVNVGNQPWMLSRHERALGLQSDLVVSFGTWLQYPADRCLATPGESRWKTLWRRFCFGAMAPFHYHVLHLYFGQSFHSWGERKLASLFRYLDVRLARTLGRKVFMTLQGCDVRLSAESNRRNLVSMCQPGHCVQFSACRASLDAQRRRIIARLLPHCDRIFVLNPELAHFVPGAVFLPYANFDVHAVEPRWPKTEGPITLLHAPTDGGIKGTPRILQAVDTLKKRWPIELLLVQNLPHAEAVKLYHRADLVIDQVLAGWYGGFAVEAMALGKPVACYLRTEDFDCLPPRMRQELPLVAVNYHSLEDDLEAALQRRLLWPEWGRRSRQFVLRWHNPRSIAQAMVEAYRHPHSVFHFEPAGEERACAA